MPGPRLDHYAIALRITREFKEGMLVNLGAGIPTLCSNLIPSDLDILLHSENGMVGYGPVIQDPERADPTLINAGGQPAEYRPGLAIIDHAESFAMVRGGFIDISVLGAYQVSARGDLANTVMPGKQIGSLGGAQDLAFRAKRLIVAMSHTDKGDRPKLVKECSTPITAPACVKLIVTDIAVIEIAPDGPILREHAPGWTVREIQDLTEPQLIVADDFREIDLA